MYQISFVDDDNEDFRIQDLLGEGSFAQVYKCIETKSQTVFALKEFDTRHDAFDEKSVEQEVMVWTDVLHENIVRLYASFTTGAYMYFVLEYVEGGSLFNHMMARHKYSEKEAAGILKQVLEALSYLHRKRIVHRDVKPDNILVKPVQRPGSQTKKQQPAIKLCDFGFAFKLPRDADVICCPARGAPMFLAPETILDNPIGRPVDMWSSGVLLHLLVAGYPPFWSDSNEKMLLAAARGQFSLSSPCWTKISKPCKELVKSMLAVQTSQRVTAVEALRHPWFLKMATLQSPLPRRKHSSTLSNSSLTERLKCTISKMHSSLKLQKNSLNHLKGKFFPLYNSAMNLSKPKYDDDSL